MNAIRAFGIAGRGAVGFHAAPFLEKNQADMLFRHRRRIPATILALIEDDVAPAEFRLPRLIRSDESLRFLASFNLDPNPMRNVVLPRAMLPEPGFYVPVLF